MKSPHQPLAGHVAIVTGAAAGIGKAYASHFAEIGADVVCGDIKAADETRRTVEEHGRCFLALELDVSSEPSVQAFAKATDASFGRADVLVNNAGIYPYALFEEMTFAHWRKVQAINFDGVFLMCKAIVPLMKRGGYGRTVNIGSSECWRRRRFRGQASPRTWLPSSLFSRPPKTLSSRAKSRSATAASCASEAA